MMELKDIQGLVARGHSELSAACYLLLGITDAVQAQAWIGHILPRVNRASEKPLDHRLHIAFTYEGLLSLGLDGEKVLNFSPEFVQGMAIPYRARLLGDLGESDAAHWTWGGPQNAPLHIMLLMYASDTATLAASVQEYQSDLAASGLVLIHMLDTLPNAGSKEHFGFHDGVSQPILPGLGKKGSPGNPEAAVGEFVLGYPNAYHELPDSPLVPAGWDQNHVLPQRTDQPGYHDLGCNGTYMVFRQLRQDVQGFWKFLEAAVKQENPSAGTAEAVQLAAKMLGRWPSGAPIVCSPDHDDPLLANENDFLYHSEDQEGFRCPVGSHIRRANPRDSLQGSKPATAQKISQRHRILRRGRNFGPPLVPDFDPEGMLHAQDDGHSRGLHFICLNTNIGRQFEFIQHTWADNTKFEGMYDDPDPILGIKDTRNKAATHDFTIPQLPVRRKIKGLQRYVHVMGGAYLFLPGLRALAFLSQCSLKTPS